MMATFQPRFKKHQVDVDATRATLKAKGSLNDERATIAHYIQTLVKLIPGEEVDSIVAILGGLLIGVLVYIISPIDLTGSLPRTAFQPA